MALCAICGAQLVLQLDFSIVNVALPSIQRGLGFSPDYLQWLVTGYALTFGSLLLAGGRLADVVGRRRLLIIGLVAFALASVLAGAAQTSAMLIGARVIQGAAGAAISPAALSLLTTMNPEGPARDRALGLWQGATAAGATLGILAGGLLTQCVGWRAIFLINPPLIVVMLLMIRRSIPTGDAPGAHSLDLRGAVLGTGVIAAVIFGVTEGQERGFATIGTLVVFAAAVILAAAFVLNERSAPSPMLPGSLFASPTRRGAIGVMLLMGGVTAGYVYFISLYLQRVDGFGPLLTGIALTPSTVTVVVTATFVNRRLLGRLGVKRMLFAGLICICAGQVWLGQMTAGESYAAAVLPAQLITAFGLGLALPTASVAITSGVAAAGQGVAGALFVAGQQTGAAIGLAILATVAAARTAAANGSLIAGYRLAFNLSAGFVLAAIALVALQIRSRHCEEEVARRSRDDVMTTHDGPDPAEEHAGATLS